MDLLLRKHGGVSDTLDIYKIKTDGTGKAKVKLGPSNTLLCTSITEYLVVIEDWIYLNLMDSSSSTMGLYRVKTDGSAAQKVLKDSPRFFSIQDSWVYYCSNDYKSIKKTKVDGSGEKVLYTLPKAGYSIYTVNVSNGYIYFSDDTESGSIETCGLYKLKSDGTAPSKIFSGQARFIQTVMDWIFFESYSDGVLVKMKSDGSKLSQR